MSGKSEEELIKMNFKQLRQHCKSLNIKTHFGATKGEIIKMILTKDPPPTASKEKVDENKNELFDNDLFDTNASIIDHDDNEYKTNTISLSEARKIIKRHCPITARYPAFVSFFKAAQFKHLSIKQFINALITGNYKLLGIKNIRGLAQVLRDWNDISKNGQWNLAKQQLNGFQPPPQCSQQEKLMFSIFSIPRLIGKVSIILQLFALREKVLDSVCFMDRFTEIMKEIMNNDTYSKIFLSAIILSKYREQPIRIMGGEQDKCENVIDFLCEITTEPTAKELFISTHAHKLTNKGNLDEQLKMIDKVQFVMNDKELNKIKKKAIKFGSAIDPQPPHIIHPEINPQEKADKIKQDMGTIIDTKALQNKLESSLKLRSNNYINDDEKKNMNYDENGDLEKYRKMLKMGIIIDAVLQEMSKDGVSQQVIHEFNLENNNIKNNEVDSISIKPTVRPKLSNAIQESINAYAVAPTLSADKRHVASYDVERGVGIHWKYALREHGKIVDGLQRLKKLIYSHDKEWYYEDNESDDNDDEKHDDFYDISLNIYMTQINRMELVLKDWMIKSAENESIVKKLEIRYHRKFRPTIYKELTTSKYNALSKALNEFDSDITISSDIIGIIWMFIEPFDELIDITFAVQCLNQFWDKEKKKIAMKKAPTHGHRGYNENLVDGQYQYEK